MSTTRIDLNGQLDKGKLYGIGITITPVTINRSYPEILSNGRMSHEEWNEFCDQVDLSLKQLSAVKNKIRLTSYVRLGFSLVLFSILMLVYVGDVMPIHRGYYAFPATLLLFIVFSNLMNYYTRKGLNNTLAEVKDVCSKFSSRRSSLKLTVRSENRIGESDGGRCLLFGYTNIHYIRIAVSKVAPRVGSPTSSLMFPIGADAAPANNPYLETLTTTTGISAADRLQELEEIRSLVTETEYQTKKEEILSMV